MKFLQLSALLLMLFASCAKAETEFPNILWITSEDNSPFLGCYGDDFARTPNLDQMAADGFLYTHAYANAPVCAPARNTIASGIYASSGGHSNMRSYYPRGAGVEFHMETLKKIGYYCTNAYKTDYNTNVKGEVWDECGKNAHYKNAPDGKPWFAIFNFTRSHESSIHQQLADDELTFDKENVPIAPYHPRTEDMKHDWAQYYQRVNQMDALVGEKLKELEESGMADNTIVFYYGDHGGVLARSKRYLYETGTRVPFIVRIPKKYKNLWPNKKTGTQVDRLVSFVDLFPTLLEIVGEEKPERLQGEAFLGEKISPDPEYAYMFRDRMDEWYDMCRAVRSEKYRYIRNYMPHRIYGLHIEYLFRAHSLQSWEVAYKNGECNEVQSRFWEPKPSEELYDTENDPWEINNLANDPAYADVLKEMREANKSWVKKIKDTGFVPEDERLILADGVPLYDYFHSGALPMDDIIDAADLASMGQKENLAQIKTFLKSEVSAIRYWGATGLLILGQEAAGTVNELKNAVNDPSVSVAVVASEALYKLGYKEEAYKGFTRALRTDREFAQTLVYNSIFLVDDQSDVMKKEVLSAYDRLGKADRKKYNYRGALDLITKWGLEVEPLK